MFTKRHWVSSSYRWFSLYFTLYSRCWRSSCSIACSIHQITQRKTCILLTLPSYLVQFLCLLSIICSKFYNVFSFQGQNLLLNGTSLPKRKVSCAVLFLFLFCFLIILLLTELSFVMQALLNGTRTNKFMMTNLEPGNADMAMIVLTMKKLFLLLRLNLLMVSNSTCNP